jgi:hypothetical protein
VPKKPKTKPKVERIVFPWMRKASRGSRRGWERRWEKAAKEGREVGPKGLEYLKRLGPDLVPSKRHRDEEEEIQFVSPKKVSRFIFVEEPIGRIGGQTKKKKKK